MILTSNVPQKAKEVTGQFFSLFCGMSDQVIAYRTLSIEDWRSYCKGQPIMCKRRRRRGETDKASAISALRHVLFGSSTSESKVMQCGEWVSSTEVLYIAIKFCGLFQPLARIRTDNGSDQEGEKIIAMQISKVETFKQCMRDLSSVEVHGTPVHSEDLDKIYQFARRSKEVLVHDSIPRSRITIPDKRVVAVHRWPFDVKECANSEFLKKMRKLNGIDLSFPLPEEIQPDMFELEYFLGGPNDRMTLCRLKKNLTNLKKGTRFVLLLAKPNTVENSLLCMSAMRK